MAELTELDRECLEYQTGYLSGLVLGSWSEPEQLTRYAFRYASVLALLGRVKEHDYYAGIAVAAAPFIGRPAAQAWRKRPLHRRLLAGLGPRARWQQAHTLALFAEADATLRRVQADTEAFREKIGRHFTKAGARR
jgi:hypothetical protein